MRVIERFLSIQGEGVFSGHRAYFLRLAGCNFRCAGFGVGGFYDGRATLGCDTQRATYGAKNASKITADEILDEIRAIFPKPLIIITGGEPLLQQNDEEFIKLIRSLNDYEIQFETNGTIELNQRSQELLSGAHFAIGFKLHKSAEKNRLNLAALKSIFKIAKSAFFKVVLSADACKKLSEYEVVFHKLHDYHDSRLMLDKNELANLCDIKDESSEEILKIWQFIKELNPNALISDELAELALLRGLFIAAQIILMPQGANISELQSNAKSVAELAIKLGFDYSDRLHIRLWDDLEGV